MIPRIDLEGGKIRNVTRCPIVMRGVFDLRSNNLAKFGMDQNWKFCLIFFELDWVVLYVYTFWATLFRVLARVLHGVEVV